MYDGGWWFDRSHWAVWPGNTEGSYYKAGDCDCYDLAEVTNATTGTQEDIAKQKDLLGLLRLGVLEVIEDLQQETVLGVFPEGRGLSNKTIMKRLRKVKKHSLDCLAMKEALCRCEEWMIKLAS